MSELFISQAVTEEIKRKIAYSSSTYLANDVYFKMNVIDLLINSYGKDNIKKKLEDKKDSLSEHFDLFINRFYKIYGDCSIAKLSQDALRDKELRKKDTFEYKRFVRDMKKINCIRPEITRLYIFLLENSMIKNINIPREYYKIIEHSNYKNISDTINKRKVGDPFNATNKPIQ